MRNREVTNQCPAVNARYSVVGQVTISSADLFNKEGLYYRAYANNFNPLDTSTSFIVGNVVGSEGPDQFWDFSKGPKDRVFRFDYMATGGLGIAQDFPDAELVEQKTDESDGSIEWLFFSQEPGTGRRVYGFYAELPFITPLNRFVPPIVDFPDQIFYGLEWTTSTTYENELSLIDPDPEEGGAFNVLIQNTHTSRFKVDAHGTILLPAEFGTFGEGLRINEEVTVEVAADFGEGQFEQLETDFVRNFYWVMPGYGIVAQLNSVQSSAPPPNNFARATAFVRMFETNKKPVTSGGNNELTPVKDLQILRNNRTILLTWSKSPGATQYRVEYTTTPTDPASWKSLGDATPDGNWRGETTTQGSARFYRVVSLK